VNATYFNSHNYFCGLQVNIRESELIENAQQQSKRVFTHLKPVDYDGMDTGIAVFGKLMDTLKLLTTSKGSTE
jgi:hypothetical protein